MTAPVEIISFGYGHGPAPTEAHATFDVRQHFRDPHVNPAFRDLTATDERVVKAVLDTPGIPALVAVIADAAWAFRNAQADTPVVIAIGCVGGRHRSAVIASEAAWHLHHFFGVPATLVHRDMDRPVIERPASPGGAS